MKNKDIHNWLSDKEIRDFLSKNLSKSKMFGSVQLYERELERAIQNLEKCKKYEAVKTLIEKNGWKEFDISDDILYDKDEYFPFIGTEEEFKMFYNKLLKESLED